MNIIHSRVLPQKFIMPKMSTTYETINAAQDLIHTLQNPSPEIPLVTLVNSHKEALIYIEYIFGKSTSPAATPRVPVERV